MYFRVVGVRCLILFWKFDNHVAIDLRINVAAQHVQDPPISDAHFAWNWLNCLLWYHSITCVHQLWTKWRSNDHDESEHKDDGTQDGKNYEPEPKEYVSLLIDNIKRQNTDGIYTKKYD